MTKPKDTKDKDPRGAHVRLYYEVIDSPAWRSLTACDQRAYLALRRQMMSFNNGDLSLPITYARHHGITNESTLAKSLRALAAVGLIAITVRAAHRQDGSRMPNLYRMTDFPTFAQPKKFIEAGPVTNEWKRVTSIAEGKALIRLAEERHACDWAKTVAARAEKKAKAGAQK